MGIATSPSLLERIRPQNNKQPSNSLFKIEGYNSSSNSMSQGFHQGIFSFSDGFDRQASSTSQDDHQHIAQQSRRDKLRVQGFDPPSAHHPLVPNPMEGEDEPGGIYDTATGAAGGNMLSEMFNFSTTPGPTATELLASQMQAGYRLPTRPVDPMVGFGSGVSDWYNNSANRQGMVLGASSSSSGLGGTIGDGKRLNADSAAAMQLFLMNPQQQQQPQPRSPSPPTPQAQLHHPAHQAFAAAAGGPFDGASPFSTPTAVGAVELQGLSLSLSSSLQQFEMAKAAHDHHQQQQQELRVRDGVLYFNRSGSSNNQNPQLLQGQGQQSQSHQAHMGYGLGPAGPAAAPASSVGVVNVLRNSKYSRAAQELLEEFCSVGRAQFNATRIRRHHGSSSSNPNPNPNPNTTTTAHAGGVPTSVAGSSSSTKDVPALSPADRFEHQRKKSKLLSMFDEASLLT